MKRIVLVLRPSPSIFSTVFTFSAVKFPLITTQLGKLVYGSLYRF